MHPEEDPPGPVMEGRDHRPRGPQQECLRGRIIGALGDRAAEQLVFGVITTGAESDLQQVTRIAREMVVRWGMSPRVGALSFRQDEGEAGLGFQKPFSEATGRLIDEEINRIVDECVAVAQDLLAANRDRLDRLAAALLRDESLDEAGDRAAVGPVPVEATGRVGPGRRATSAAAMTTASEA